ncbi:MAG: UvrD-helicase domain-containing protein, partial [Merdibacter sp.]
QVSKMIHELFNVLLNHYELDEVYRKLCECKGSLMVNSEIAKISYPGIDFLYLYQQLEAYKQQRSLMSYEDLMAQAYQCLLKEPALCEQLRSHYRYIHVDDAQNLSFAAYMLLRLITDDDTSIVLFIDNDQYAGAHAPYRMNYEDFQAAYPQVRKVVLSQNYRCDANIDEMIQKFMHSDHDFQLKDDSVVRFITAKDLDASYRNALVLAKNNPGMTFLSREHFTLLPLADLLDREGSRLPSRTSTAFSVMIPSMI